MRKPSKCQVCRAEYFKVSAWQKICPKLDCVISFAAKEKEKRLRKEAKIERKDLAERREKIKTLTDWIADVQKVFNAYIRERDRFLPCICCGKMGGVWSRGGIWDAGHYRSRGSAGHLRFDERNVHKQLKQCNSYGAGRHSDFRIGLIERNGLQEVLELEADQTIRKWSIDELRSIKSLYAGKLKALKAENDKKILEAA